MAVVILRPTGDGTYSEFTPSPAGDSYSKVNEVVADDDATYIEAPASVAKTSTFTKDNIASGLPLSVSVKGRGISAETNYYSCVCLVIGGTRYYAVVVTTDTYVQFEKVFSYNPATNKAWTLDDVNSLEFGVHQTAPSLGFQVTQVWLEVTLADNALEIDDTGSGTDSIPANHMITMYDMEAAYDSEPGDPNWNEDCDLNNDDVINFADMLILSESGGEIWFTKGLAASIPVTDSGSGVEQITGLLADMALNDSGSGVEAIALTGEFAVIDTGNGSEAVVISANIPVTDSGSGTDSALVAKAYFLVDSDSVLHPLGVIVIRGGQEDLIPGTRENTEEIPGRHGEIDFGSEFKSRLLELRVVNSTDPATREQLKRTLAKWLNPMLGVQPLIFSSDIEKTFYVKYAGKIDLTQYPNFLEFTIPFKAGDPFIIGTYEKTHTGSGTLTSEGTFEAPLTVTIEGPVINPQVTVGSATLSYTGTLASGDTLIIDTGAITVTFNGANAMANYTGEFPKLQPGDTAVTAASAGTTTFTWRDRWI